MIFVAVISDVTFSLRIVAALKFLSEQNFHRFSVHEILSEHFIHAKGLCQNGSEKPQIE